MFCKRHKRSSIPDMGIVVCNIEPTTSLDDSGSKIVSFVEVSDSDINSRQLPEDFNLNDMVRSQEFITPQSMDFITPTDKLDIQNSARSRAIDMINSEPILEPTPEPTLEPTPEPTPIV